MTVLTENRGSAGYLVSEEGMRSRDQITVKQQTYSAGVYVTQGGTVLSIYGPSTGAPVYAATGGNTGNFTCSAVVEGAGALVGAYKVEFFAATKYNVFDPNGALVGEGTTGSIFSAGGLTFTITAGGTPAAAGDSATITVAANADAGKYGPLNLSGTDGTQNAVAILFNTIDLSPGDTKATVTARATEVNASELVWPSGATANQIAAATAQLALKGIIAR